MATNVVMKLRDKYNKSWDFALLKVFTDIVRGLWSASLWVSHNSESDSDESEPEADTNILDLSLKVEIRYSQVPRMEASNWEWSLIEEDDESRARCTCILGVVVHMRL